MSTEERQSYNAAVDLIDRNLRAGRGEKIAVIDEVARILPIMTIVFFLMGPLMMIATHFQAIGSAGKAATLGLTKTYAFAIPLTFALPALFGEVGIWYGGIVAEVLAIMLTVLVLWHHAARHNARWGLAT